MPYSDARSLMSRCLKHGGGGTGHPCMRQVKSCCLLRTRLKTEYNGNSRTNRLVDSIDIPTSANSLRRPPVWSSTVRVAVEPNPEFSAGNAAVQYSISRETAWIQ